MTRYDVYDDVLPDPAEYRRAVLASPFQSITIGPAVFHGIGLFKDLAFPTWLAQRYPTLQPTLTFCRQSPAGQAEPNFIHTDMDMGDWTGILYLTPEPPAEDGTTFWRHRETGAVASAVTYDEARLQECFEWRDLSKWEPWARVPAKFNRCVVFPGRLFHSRSIPENFGAADGARLIQVVFGTGDFAARHEVPVCQ